MAAISEVGPGVGGVELKEEEVFEDKQWPAELELNESQGVEQYVRPSPEMVVVQPGGRYVALFPAWWVGSNW